MVLCMTHSTIIFLRKRNEENLYFADQEHYHLF